MQVLGETVSKALEHSGGDEASETAKFVRMMDRFFDCLNITNLTNGMHEQKSFQDPYTNANDFYLKVMCHGYVH